MLAAGIRLLAYKHREYGFNAQQFLFEMFFDIIGNLGSIEPWIVVDKNTLRAMSLGSVTSTVFVWSNTADIDRRLCFPFFGYYCQLESRNVVILDRSRQFFFHGTVFSKSLWHYDGRWDTTTESSLFWWQVSPLIIWVTEWLKQWRFGFWFRIINYLSPETKKKTKKMYLLYLQLQNKPHKTWIISKLMLRNCPFRILFQFHHSLCIETCIHPSIIHSWIRNTHKKPMVNKAKIASSKTSTYSNIE